MIVGLIRQRVFTSVYPLAMRGFDNRTTYSEDVRKERYMEFTPN